MNGQKTLEVRLGHDFFTIVSPGDTVIFNGLCRRKIGAIRKYANFEALLLVENYQNILPGVTRDELLSLMKQYIRGDVEKLGVLVFELGSY